MKRAEILKDMKLLILKYILGIISDEEKERLNSWRQESQEHEDIFQWLRRAEHHEEEYLFRQSVNTEQALHAFKKKVEKLEVRSNLRSKKQEERGKRQEARDYIRVQAICSKTFVLTPSLLYS